MGVINAVVHTLKIGDGKTAWTSHDLLHLKNWCEDAGLKISVIEGSVPLTDRGRLGLDGRDEDIEVFKEFLRDCGRLNIPVICYDWMVGIR